MEDYRAQYYDEALMHYGVKGMKWGVRKARKAGRAARAYGKTAGRALGNVYTHPVLTSKAIRNIDKGAPNKTKLRRHSIGYSTKELNTINKEVKKSAAAAKRKRRRRAAKIRKQVGKAARGAGAGAKQVAAASKKSVKSYGNFQKERSKAFGNAFAHPIMSERALKNNMKNDKLRTKLRKQLYITTKEYEAINRDVKRQKAARRRRKQK